MFMISLEVIHEKILDLNFLEKKKEKQNHFSHFRFYDIFTNFIINLFLI